MNNAADKLLQQQLQQLAQQYANSLPANVSRIGAAIERLLSSSANSETIEALRRHVHRLKGSGTTFGFHEISRTARALEELLRTALGQTGPLSADQNTQICHALADLREAAEHAHHSVAHD